MRDDCNGMRGIYRCFGEVSSSSHLRTGRENPSAGGNLDPPGGGLHSPGGGLNSPGGSWLVPGVCLCKWS